MMMMMMIATHQGHQSGQGGSTPLVSNAQPFNRLFIAEQNGEAHMFWCLGLGSCVPLCLSLLHLSLSFLGCPAPPPPPLPLRNTGPMDLPECSGVLGCSGALRAD